MVLYVQIRRMISKISFDFVAHMDQGIRTIRTIMQIWKLFGNIPSGFEKVFLAVDSYLEVPLNVREGNKQKQIKSRNSQIP